MAIVEENDNRNNQPGIEMTRYIYKTILINSSYM